MVVDAQDIEIRHSGNPEGRKGGRGESPEHGGSGGGEIATLHAASSLDAYAYGSSCTWHDWLDKAENHIAGRACCPKCGGELTIVPSSLSFWETVRDADKKHPGYADMYAWARGKCFPDFDHLENAYRQAMEGQ